MAAEMEFADPALFKVFEVQEESTLTPVPTCFKEAEDGLSKTDLQQQLRHFEETDEQLLTQNQERTRKPNLLTRPRGMQVNNAKGDGPLFQILFMNSAISKRYHQEVEEFVSNLGKRFQEEQRKDVEKTSFDLLPQPSSLVLEEDHKVEGSCVSNETEDAFTVVGSVLYFPDFCLDKLGRPLLQENPQLTEGWEIPKYQQVFRHILPLEGRDAQAKARRPKLRCFNCDSEDHQMKGCPEPRNVARIRERRKEHVDACGEANSVRQRYHEEIVEERFARFKPGVISEGLQDALGVRGKSLPPFIYQMRQMGYPPGWLKEAELDHSGLALYGGRDDADGEIEPGEIPSKRIAYDLTKLVSYPGFNIPAPKGIADEWRKFGSIPMQACQQKHVFAKDLTSNFQSPSKKSGRQRSSSQCNGGCPQKRKERRPHQRKEGHPQKRKEKHPQKRKEKHPLKRKEKHPLKRKERRSAASPAHVDFHSHGAQSSPDLQHQPPLTPGTPSSLLWTPTLLKGTPPVAPRDSPGTKSAAPATDEKALALQEASEKPELRESQGPDACTEPAEAAAPWSPVSEGELLCQTTEQESADVDSELARLDNGSAGSSWDIIKESGQKLLPADTRPLSTATKTHSGRIPDLSKFSTGIMPLTFENLAQPTGMYLRIRNLLKNSSRNQQKNKIGFRKAT